VIEKSYTMYDVEGRPGGRWKRIVLWTLVGLLVLLLAGGGGSYLWFRGQVAGANRRVAPEVKAALAEKPGRTIVSVPQAAASDTPASPSAMNLLVLGSDRRENEEERGRSDTIILVHVDPDKDYLSVMSLPRDLRVEVPGHGLEKINAAFAFGGPALTIRTVEQLTGVDINHYLEVDFNAFRDITDSLDGVYVDVDRRYYNDDPHWELIKLAPGYQLLKGDDALDYVRFRHDLNMDFGRMERQQRFLSAMREQAMGWDLPFKLPGLVSALFKNVNTDLGANDILKLAYWGIGLDGDRIRQVSVVGATDTIGGVSYVLADEAAIADAVSDFLTIPGTNAASAATATSTTDVGTDSSSTDTSAAEADLRGSDIDILNANGRSGEAAAAGEWLRSLGATVHTVGTADQTAQKTTSVKYPSGTSTQAKLVAGAVGAESVSRSSSVERVTVFLGEDFSLPAEFALPPSPGTIPNSSEWKALAKMVPYSLQAPAHLPTGYVYADRMPPKGSTYDIEVGNGNKPALKMLYRLKEKGHNTDQYMGITETTWLDAPAAGKGREVEQLGITFTIVGTNQKVERIWWKADGVLYWVSNTLSYLLSKDEMLAVAESMISIPDE
jgi:polyisoprenyl-teichoic acid--peptidoglycan teichoic acid transferase